MTKEAFENLILEKEKNSNEIYEKLIAKPAVVLPAGRISGMVTCELINMNIDVVAMGDKDPANSFHRRDSFQYKGKNVLIGKTSEVARKWGNNVNYVVYANLYKKEIVKELLDCGIDQQNIFGAPTLIGYLVPSNPEDRLALIYQNFSEIEDAVNMLADEESKRELWDILSIFCAKESVWVDKEMLPEYFRTPYIRFQADEVFVDAGVYDGETIAEFVEVCPNYKEIIGIEANPNNILMIRNRLEGYRDIRILNNALSNKRGELRFKRDGVGPEGACLSEDGELVVEGIIGDEMGMAPTFIKFDIEGAEGDALMGFKETIKRCKPQMAISAYHSLQDHWRLIKIVKEICPDYKLYIKHHYGFGVMYGTILYATIR